MCVQLTAADAFLREYRVWVPADCTAAETGKAKAQRAGRTWPDVLKCEVHPSLPAAGPPLPIPERPTHCSTMAPRGAAMSLGTIIHAGLTRPDRPVHALVLMGGGARTAYQVGRAAGAGGHAAAAARAGRGLPVPGAGGHLGRRAERRLPRRARAHAGLGAVDQLRQFWSRAALRATSTGWRCRSGCASAGCWPPSSCGATRAAAAPSWTPCRWWTRCTGAISLAASSRRWPTARSTPWRSPLPATPRGVHWTFCHTRATDRQREPWHRPGRRAEFQPLTIEHLMASSAIPFLFPATPLWVDGRREYFGDGSMRQVSPLSPAMHLGAHRILVVGVGQPERAGLSAASHGRARPAWAAIAGHAMASVFHDTLQADVEQAQRLARTLHAAAARSGGRAALSRRRRAGAAALRSRSTRSRADHAARAARRGAARARRPGRAARRRRAWPATCCSSPVSCRR